MRIGPLNKLIAIQHHTEVSDGMGGFTESWVDHDTVWAAIWPLSANEIVKNNQASMVITHRIRMRFRANMNSSWRLKYGNRYFDIVSIINQDEANRVLDIMCKEAA